MPARKDARTGKWYFRKWVELPSGKRKRLYGSPFDTKREADDAERDAIAEAEHPVKPPSPRFADWFEGRFWREWVLGGPRGANRPSEQEAKRSIFRVHLRDYFGDIPLDKIDHSIINTFRAQLRGRVDKKGQRELSEKTINNILAVLSKPLTYAVKVGVLDRAPSVGVAKVERPEAKFLEFEEVAALLDAASRDREPEYVVAILLAVEAGLRIGEVKALHWEHVDMKARTITVSQQVRPVSDQGGSKVEVFGPPKGKTRRTVPMSPALYNALRHRLPRAGFVVPSANGKHKRTQESRSAMERIAKRAELAQQVGGEWHILRHTFATHAAALGVNPWSLNQWMGHKRMEETMLYVSLANQHKRDTPAKLLAVGATEPDPDKRILAMLSARITLDFRAADGQRAAAASRKRK